MAGETSRRNGRKSRGPRTPAGLARSAQNARRHGFASQPDVLAWGPRLAELTQLFASPYHDCPLVAERARDLAMLELRLRDIARAQAHAVAIAQAAIACELALARLAGQRASALSRDATALLAAFDPVRDSGGRLASPSLDALSEAAQCDTPPPTDSDVEIDGPVILLALREVARLDRYQRRTHVARRRIELELHAALAQAEYWALDAAPPTGLPAAGDSERP